MTLKVADLFSGAGFFSEGWKKAGCEIVLANEMIKPFADIYRENNKNVNVIEGDIREKKQEICDFLKKEDVGVIIGGFPCQSFSMSGLRDPNDSRGFLYKEFLDVVKEVKPTVFVCENVKGILSATQMKDGLSTGRMKKAIDCLSVIQGHDLLSRTRSQRSMTVEEQASLANLESKYAGCRHVINMLTEPVIEKIKRDISSIGYRTKFKLLNAAHFGVPQFRERVFIVGFDEGIDFDPFPERDHFSRKMLSSREFQVTSLLDEEVKKPYVTAKMAMRDLENKDEDAEFFHIFSKNSPEFLERIKETANGKSVYDNYKESYYRLFPDSPSPTVKENHSGVFLHYSKDRLVSPRELGRLQTIPDSFKLIGKKSRVLTAIGNGVPTLLAERIAKRIRDNIG